VREQGRCAGCEVNGELKQVAWHVLLCEKWAALYRENPAAALPPAQEYARWREQDRAAEHAAALRERIGDTQDRRAASVARFQKADPLGAE
jgi:hypothetical protein